MATALRLTRRQALALAAGGAAGAASLRLVTLDLGGSSPSAQAGGLTAGPGGAWRSPLADPRGAAAHLLRRAGFAHTGADLDRAAGMSYADLVDSVVAGQPEAMPAPPKPTDHASVVQTWFAHMATTQAQFAERMTLFWHGHLTSDFRKANGLPLVLLQNTTYREKGLTDLRSLLLAATYDPLMGRYLDLQESTAAAPNENYARELMELFTLGVGNYTETDVREGARALSGIRSQLVDAGGRPAKPPAPDRSSPTGLQDYDAKLDQLAREGYTYRGVVVPRQHDQGTKTLLGRTGNLGPEEAVDAILAQDACATHVASKALLFFATPQPSPGYVARVAAALRSSRYDIRTMMGAIFRDAEFLAAGNYRSLVRSPADLMVATMRILAQPDISAVAVTAGLAMDQVLYDPPTVAGWPVNGGWVSSSALLARLNFAQEVVHRGGAMPDPAAAVQTHLDGIVGDDTARVFDASPSVPDRWYAILCSPEFQLK
ncbi:MAG TPA: DUF1800 domain-containing protein [Candidatus Dormibacteraeota bacterium]|nr:DUF1800 domain-containing protein [Candidatus Dormibacteraeota bacterium]